MLTPSQREALTILAPYAGQTVEVLTSGYTANIAPDAVRSAVATIKSQTLRGLAAQGHIRIIDSYWKGARIHVNP